MLDHFVQVGSLGLLGRFPSADGITYRRGMSVICRTARGLEFGSVLNTAAVRESRDGDPDVSEAPPLEDRSVLPGPRVGDSSETHSSASDVTDTHTDSETFLATSQLPNAGQILRGATAEDHLLWNRLQKHRIEAIDACQHVLTTNGLSATLMDCEVLFDGQSILFYFLGEVPPEVQAVTDELAKAYDARAQLRQFADAMALGCGPDCGTQDGGCSSGGCATCSLASHCHTTDVREP